VLPAWLAEEFSRAERDWASIPVCARPIYVGADMENPATWGPAERVVREVLDADHQMRLSPEPICGLSLERRITDALCKADLLVITEDGEDQRQGQPQREEQADDRP
jgi:hypothetical protein